MKKAVNTPATVAWDPVCRINDLIMLGSVAVRAHGQQVAIFRIDEELFGIDNLDPFCGAAILSRGIVGDLKGQLVVASPMYKQHFCLETGRCLENDSVSIRVWPVRTTNDGIVSVGLPGTDSCKEDNHAMATSP